MNKIQNFPLHMIKKNPFQQNVVDDVKVLEIAASLQQNRDNGNKGLLQVTPARQLPDGTVELAFGHHRFYAFEVYAKKMEKVAEEWEIKLPKDFLDQAQKYQNELDAALKELAPAKTNKKGKK